MRNLGQEGGVIGALHEILFSVNLSLLAVAWDASREAPRLIGMVAGPLRQAVAALLGVSILRSRFLFDFDFIATWCLLTMVVYACLYLLGKIFQLQAVLAFVLPVVAAGGLPIYWLRVGGLASRLPAAMYWCLVSELVLVLGFIIQVSWRAWPANRPIRVFLLALHFGLWTWFSRSPIWFWTWLIYPSVGFSSIVVWDLYLAKARGVNRCLA